MRDRYGRLLERGEHPRWQEIRDFEGGFLTDSFFENPAQRQPYSRSYNRLRKAYTNLGIPLPKAFSEPPTAEFMRARYLVLATRYDEARTILKDIIDSEGYALMTPDEGTEILCSHVKCIKNPKRMQTLQDWEEIHRTLSILVERHTSPEFERDLRAAERQIERMKMSSP
jgi:hypothetical protein